MRETENHSNRKNYGRLRGITRAQLEPLWMRFDMPSRKIAEVLGVSRQAISQRAREFGLPPRPSGPSTARPEDTDLFCEMWLAGVRRDDMARALGYSCGRSVKNRANSLGLPRRTRGKGGRNGYTSITVRQFHEAKLAERMRELTR